MAIDLTKKYREPIAFALLAVAALWFVGGLSLLFKSADVGFATKAALVGGAFEAPIAVLSLVVAVLLVTRFGDPSPNARVVVLAALAIVGLDLLFGVITFLAQFGSDQGSVTFGFVFAGKVVRAILGLAELTFLVVAAGYIATAFQGLPAPVASAQRQWGGPGYAGYGPGAQQPPGAQPYAQPYAQSGSPGWGQQPPAAYGWVPPEQSHPSGWSGQPGQGAPGAGWPAQQSQTGWGQQPPQASQTGWGQQGGYGAPPASQAPPAAQWHQEPTAGGQPFDWDQPEPPTSYVETTPADDAGQPEPAVDTASAAETDLPESDVPEPDVPESGVPEPEPTAADEDGAPDTPGGDSGWWQHPQR